MEDTNVLLILYFVAQAAFPASLTLAISEQ
jgi:hypothetical protein